jgi:hypothetical protein
MSTDTAPRLEWITNLIWAATFDPAGGDLA